MTLMRGMDVGTSGHDVDVLYRTGDKLQLRMHFEFQSHGAFLPHLPTCSDRHEYLRLPLIGGSSAHIFSPHTV